MIAQESSTPDNAQPAGIRPWLAVAAALIAGNCLLLVAPPGPMRTAGALLTLVLPGLALAEVLLSNTSRLLRWTVGAGLGYAFIIGAGLALPYLPGPLSRWGVLVLADGLSLLLIVILLRSGKRAESHGDGSRLIPLVMILLVAGLFRFASLGYSEFQGDEVKAMMPAARVLAGDPDALMLERKKGPAEILLPMLPWRLAETTDEASARLPFALAGLGTLATVFLLGRKLGGNPAGFAAAGVAALNGLLIAFSRIVQYQAIVLWMSALGRVVCVGMVRARADALGPPGRSVHRDRPARTLRCPCCHTSVGLHCAPLLLTEQHLGSATSVVARCAVGRTVHGAGCCPVLWTLSAHPTGGCHDELPQQTHR